jgi:hypothetical protein
VNWSEAMCLPLALVGVPYALMLMA